MTMLDIYAWRDPSWGSLDLKGFDVVASDGDVGKVDEETRKTNGDVIVVQTSTWLDGDKVAVPVGMIGAIDLDAGTLFVDRTKDEIEDAPRLPEEARSVERYRDELARHFGASRTR